MIDDWYNEINKVRDELVRRGSIKASKLLQRKDSFGSDEDSTWELNIDVNEIIKYINWKYY